MLTKWRKESIQIITYNPNSLEIYRVRKNILLSYHAKIVSRVLNLVQNLVTSFPLGVVLVQCWDQPYIPKQIASGKKERKAFDAHWYGQ